MEVDPIHDIYILPTDELARQQGCYLDFSLPDKIEAFAEEYCTLQTDDYSGKAGRKIKLLPWQRTFIRTLFGWLNEHGDLRFTYASVWCGRRQGKSLILSILCTFFMLKHRRSIVPIVASCKDEADAIFDRCDDFVSSHPDLIERCKPVRSHQVINDKLNLGSIKVLSCIKTGKLGKGIQLLALDELAAWPKSHARLVFDRLHDSLKDKVNAVKVSISTPQDDLSSLGREKFLEADSILRGESKDISTLPVIYSAPENWKDLPIEECLKAALPSLNLTTPLHKYLTEWEQVKGTINEPNFCTMNLGLWVGSCEYWIPPAYWEANREKFNEVDLYGQKFDEIVCSMDWAASYDYTAYLLMLVKGDLHYLLPRFFIPKLIAAKREKTDKMPLTKMAEKGLDNLHLTDGDVVNAMDVIEQLKLDRARFGIHEVRFDKTKMALVDQMLIANGFHCVPVSTGQTTMVPAFEKVEHLIRNRQFRHNDNRLTNWMLGNCRKKPDGMVVKSGSDNKIDIVDCMAIGVTKWLDGKTAVPVLPEGQSWAFSF